MSVSQTGSFLQRLAIWVRNHNLIPGRLRRFIQTHVNVLDVRMLSWIAKDPFANAPSASSYKSEYPYTIGILKEFWHMHWHYVAACEDLQVSYKVLDISGPDWRAVVERSCCDAFLVQPSVQLSQWKQMYDERLRIMVEDMGKIIFPSYEELWIYESKRRTYYWLEANKIAHPRTWVFYDLERALEFVKETELPIVFKTDMGAGSSGVTIFRGRSALRNRAVCCFRKGYTTPQRGPNDKEWGNMLLQEYLENVREWRMIRVGNSYFGFEKMRVGDFHSGSHRWRCARPDSKLLDFVKAVTDKGGFLSMAVDVLVDSDGRYFVNELHALFGMEHPDEMCVVDGQAGRMLLDSESNSWRFEAGNFTHNNLCNLRIVTLFEILRKLPSPGGTLPTITDD